jgi:hypothetical protein
MIETTLQNSTLRTPVFHRRIVVEPYLPLDLSEQRRRTAKNEECSMATPAKSGFEKEFPLDPAILGPNSAAKVAVSSTTSADVLQALVNDSPFPTRPNGKLELGSIMLQAQGGNKIAFNAGQGTVGFDFSAGFHTGLGVFDQPADAIGSLQTQCSSRARPHSFH